MKKFDVLVVGAGQAGPALARQLAGKGQKVAVAEGNRVGGSCVNYGCTPSKTIIASAKAIHTARRGEEFGFHTDKITVDFPRVMQRQRDIVSAMRESGEKRMNETKNLAFFPAYAKFESANTMRVGDEVVEAERIYLNIGARATIPPIEGLDEIDYLTNESILDLNELPRHLIILGGGYISMEYGQAFRRLGSDVTVIDTAPHILNREDEDISQAVQDILAGEGIRFMLEHKAVRVEQRDANIVVHVEGKGEAATISGSHLLVAVGRTPNSDKLNVENAGLKLDDKGFITVDNHLKTNLDHVYVLGEANGRGAFTHTAYNDYEIALDNINGGKRKVSDRIPTYGVFVDPPLGRVGMSEREARESDHDVLMGVMPMKDINRAVEFAQTDGLMKVLVDAKTERILGAAVLGIGGDEVIHAITTLMYARAPYTVMQNAVHIHPTISELLPTLLQDLKPLK
jgi:pyruvate/2-oxoglutarate dehydrogenase complex dihydrolipoamide dehydrogenase (E3) component